VQLIYHSLKASPVFLYNWNAICYNFYCSRRTAICIVFYKF